MVPECIVAHRCFSQKNMEEFPVREIVIGTSNAIKLQQTLRDRHQQHHSMLHHKNLHQLTIAKAPESIFELDEDGVLVSVRGLIPASNSAPSSPPESACTAGRVR